MYEISDLPELVPQFSVIVKVKVKRKGKVVPVLT
jgi:hypothetical protein